jgi:hypothetical protein
MKVPRRTTIYKVVTAESIENLEKEVNELLDSGWELAGGVSVSVVTDWRENDLAAAYSTYIYAQSMITTL